MSNLTIFNNEQFGEIRTVVIDGEPWFVALDLCKALEIRTDTVRAIVDDEDVSEVDPNTVGVIAKGRNPLIVSEAGMYALVMKSRKESAVAFRRWITHEDWRLSAEAHDSA